MMKFRLTRPLAPYGDADPYDVHAIKVALNHLGYYTPPPAIGIEEFREPGLFNAITAFQRDRNIPEATHIFPHDATVYALNSAVMQRNPVERYIWRTAGDKRVRPSHAAHAGRIFVWGQPPDEGHPGEDFNCRCWAEPVVENQVRERERICINLWNAIQDAEKRSNELRKRIEHYKNEITRKKEQIEKLRAEIQDIVGTPTPDIFNLEINALIKFIEKIVGKIELITKIERIYKISEEIIDLKNHTSGLEASADFFNKELEASIKEEERLREEFGITCPNYF